MPAPLSPTTSYAAGSTPSIRSQDLNDLENYLYNGIYSAQNTIKSLTIDGVGGNSVSRPAAQLAIQQSALADSPLLLLSDKAGNVRSLFDHNGYQRGRVNPFFEDWLTIGPATVSGASTVSTGRLNWSIPAASSLLLDSSTLGGSTGARLLATNAANASVLRLNSSAGVVGNGSFVSSVQEFDIAAVTLTAFDLIVGLISGPVGNGGTPTLATYIALCKRTTDTHWQLLTGTGGTPNLVDTGVTPTALDTILIEAHGTSSPFGAATARIFINNMTTPVATTTTSQRARAQADPGAADAGAGRASWGPEHQRRKRAVSFAASDSIGSVRGKTEGLTS